MRRVLGMAAAVPLAFLWHGLGVMMLLPLGGGEAHWVFRRVGGGSSHAMLVVIADYLLLAVALLLLLKSRTVIRGVAVVGTVIVVSAAVGSYLLRMSLSETAYTTVVVGAPLLVVAGPLWRLRGLVPTAFKVAVAAAPGTWSIWDLCGFPFDKSSWRPGGLPVSWLYPAAFLTVLVMYRFRGESPSGSAAAEPAAAADERSTSRH